MKCQKNKILTLDDAYKYLDRERFHLCLGGKWNGTIPYIEFKLFRQYPNGDPIYYSEDNKLILSGDDRNQDDVEKLVEYLKVHYKRDIIKLESKFTEYYSIIMAILAIINMICSLFKIIPLSLIRFTNIAIISSEIPMLLLTLIRYKSLEKNFQVDSIEQLENYLSHSDLKTKKEENIKVLGVKKPKLAVKLDKDSLNFYIEDQK